MCFDLRAIRRSFPARRSSDLNVSGSRLWSIGSLAGGSITRSTKLAVTYPQRVATEHFSDITTPDDFTPSIPLLDVGRKPIRVLCRTLLRILGDLSSRMCFEFQAICFPVCASTFAQSAVLSLLDALPILTSQVPVCGASAL